MKKPLLNVTSVLAAAGILLMGYAFFASIPDIKRCIGISNM